MVKSSDNARLPPVRPGVNRSLSDNANRANFQKLRAAFDCGDSTYSSTSEAEPDSDPEEEEEDDDPNDPEKLLTTWIGELENLKLGIDNVVSGNRRPGDKLAIAAPRIDSYRFSRANLEDSQDVDLDAILGELCALENQFDREMHRGHARSASAHAPTLEGLLPQSLQQQSGIGHNNPSANQRFSSSSSVGVFPTNSSGSGGPGSVTPGSGSGGHIPPGPGRYPGHSRSSSGGTRPKFEIGGLHTDVDNEDGSSILMGGGGKRTDSPDNDSAFSDNVSMLSSESSASSGGGNNAGGRIDPNSSQLHHHNSISSKSSCVSLATSPTQLLDQINRRLHAIQIEVEKDKTSLAEQAARIKAEKIKIALEKIKEASIKKLFIKAFSADHSAKSLMVDERMSVGLVCRLLADKNHVAMDPKWAVVELIPELYMERIYEDHELLVENLLLWTRDSCNKLLFLERDEKYDLFNNPEDYLLGCNSSECGADLDDDGKITLLEEFFSISGVGVPEVEGPLYLKSDGKKAWKKYFFVLRASGLYYSPKGKSKFSKDLICLTTFEMNNVYGGLGWKKKYKAPTDFGFAIKHPQIQTKSSKYIKYLCAEDDKTLRQWVMGIRIAKYGRQLKDNYDTLMRDIEEEDLDTLAHARSFSICSMAKTLQVSPDGSNGGSPESPSDAGGPGERKNSVISNPISPGHHGRRKDSDGDSNRSSNSTPTPTSTLDQSSHYRRESSVGRQDSVRSSASSSSGCLSERSSSGTPTAEQIAFDADFPVGTIKRKPSMTPKIPLTSTTRNIAKQSEDCLTGNVRSSPESGLRSPTEPLSPTNGRMENGSGGNTIYGNLGTVGRNAGGKFTLRRSQTDDKIHVNGFNFKNNKTSASSSPQHTMVQFQQVHQQLKQAQLQRNQQQQNLYDSLPRDQIQPDTVGARRENLTRSQSHSEHASSSYQSDSETEFPLPPPPPELATATPIVSENEDFMPPPPPEAFKGSTLSLDSISSLPPPPPPLNLDNEQSWPSTSSLNSLPPPPSPLVQSPTKQSDSRASTPEAPPMPSSPVKVSPTVPPKPSVRFRRMSETDAVTAPPFLAELKSAGLNGLSPPHTLRKGKWRKMSADPAAITCYGTAPRSPHSSQSSSGSSSKSSSSSTLSPSNSLSPQRKPEYWMNSNGGPASPVGSPQQTPPAIPQHQGFHYQQQQLQARQFQQQQQNYQQYQQQYGGVDYDPYSTVATMTKPQPQSQQPSHYQKPSPPRRSEMTKLSNNGAVMGGVRRSSSQGAPDASFYPCANSQPGPPPGPIPPPPEEFLKDLQRVMDKKWKVAQQLSIDLTSSPNEILGFRDPCYRAPVDGVTSPQPSPSHHHRQAAQAAAPPTPVSPQPSSSSSSIVNANYENVYGIDYGYATNNECAVAAAAAVASAAAGSNSRRLSRVSPEDIGRTFVISRKKAPPPPPKRSETTQLTRR